MTSDISKVTLFASLNLGVSSITGFFSNLEPFLKDCVYIGQAAVAIVTVIYIVKKTRSIRKRRREK